jgi:putative tryptophan/tyrosine transport system substrate-binding protein
LGNSTKSMKRKISILAVFAMLLALSFSAQAQQPTKASRIGFLNAGSPATSPARQELFRQGLRQLGYVEGKNIVIDWRYAEGKPDRLPALAAELVRLKVDIIVTGGGISTRSAKDATVTIPIVMTQDIDPVGNGFVASLARPGGNITGLSTLAPEISGKQMELLKEIVPKFARVAVLGTTTNPGTAQALKETELAAGAFKVQLQYLDVLGPKDINTGFRTATKAHADAVLVLISSVLNTHRAPVVNLAVKSRLPVMYPFPEFVEAGGLMSYGVSFADLWRRAATYVDKILKGAKPADLPVEQPKKFELIINVKSAKQIGLTIPPNVLVRADKVIR